MSGIVKVYQTIRTNGWAGPEELMETTFSMDFLPDVGDVIHPLKNDADSGLSFEVRSRYWDRNGKTILQLTRVVIDPPGDNRLRGWSAWWTSRDGDLIDMLLKNGWWKYGQEPNRANL